MLRIFNRARGLRVQIFRSGQEEVRTRDNVTMNGVPVMKQVGIGSSKPGRLARIRIGAWPSGLYFARVEAADGRVGFAPFVVRPRRLGRHDVAVVMPTLTWQAYNLRDMNGDGKGDSWYACRRGGWRKCPTGEKVALGRPFLNRGVPSHFRSYDLPFLKWLSKTDREVDYLAQADLEAAPNPSALARAYKLIVFPGHHEYVTKREYNLVEGYRDRGGNLMFLSANNFFMEVVREKTGLIRRTKAWRNQNRPEAALIGVQYVGSDGGRVRGRWTLRPTRATNWLVFGTSLRAGHKFADGGIEIDRTTKDSPRNVEVLAVMRNLFGRGYTAQMTYYETRRGAKVFAAGAFSLAGGALRPEVSLVLDNLWRRLSRP
jgi:N,N-dimethylformamidase beta subunit-like, C-terminal